MCIRDSFEDYAASASLKLQVYPGRPRSIAPPTAFIDRIGETYEYTGPVIVQRVPTVEALLLHGLFDAKDTVDQADVTIEGIVEWARTRFHQAGANTLIAITSTEDDPNYVPDWLPPEQQRTYFATRITLEGFNAEN